MSEPEYNRPSHHLVHRHNEEGENVPFSETTTYSKNSTYSSDVSGDSEFSEPTRSKYGGGRPEGEDDYHEPTKVGFSVTDEGDYKKGGYDGASRVEYSGRESDEKSYGGYGETETGYKNRFDEETDVKKDDYSGYDESYEKNSKKADYGGYGESKTENDEERKIEKGDYGGYDESERDYKKGYGERTETEEGEAVDYKTEEKHNKHLEHLGELGAAAAGAFALHEKHEVEEPEYGHRHKLEEEIAAVAAVGGGGFAFHEHHEKKEAKEKDEE